MVFFKLDILVRMIYSRTILLFSNVKNFKDFDSAQMFEKKTLFCTISTKKNLKTAEKTLKYLHTKKNVRLDNCLTFSD